jgi:SSS family solute:Na+ symporter
MNWMLTPAVVVAFLAVTLFLGIRASSGRQRSVAEHVVAGRGLPLLLVFFIAVGEIYSSLSFLGQPGWGYAYGVPILWATMNGTMVAMMSYWLGPLVWKVGKEKNYLTQAQFLGASYESPALRGVVAIVSLVALLPYISVQIIGAGYVFRVTTSGRIPYWLGSLIAFSVVAIYVSKGGLRGISWVAVFKGIFMLTVGGLCVILVIRHFYGSLPEMFRRIAARSPEHLTLPGKTGIMNYAFWTSSLIIGMFGFYMWPHLFQNFFSAKDALTIKRQAALIPVYNIVGWAFIMVGFAGILVVKNTEPDAVMIEMVMRSVPPWLVAFFCAGALSASMVTAAAATLVAAATLANDLFQPALMYPDEKLRRLIQILVLVVMSGAYLFAILQSSTIAFIMLMAYGFVSQFFPLVMAALLLPGRVRASSALTALVVGVVVTGFFTVGPIARPGGFHPGFLGLLANCGALLIAGSITGHRKHNGVSGRL